MQWGIVAMKKSQSPISSLSDAILTSIELLPFEFSVSLSAVISTIQISVSLLPFFSAWLRHV
jgi:hypothetical protein